jgi:hypothetical protein
MSFVAHFLGRRLAYTYEIVDLVPGERLIMRTAEPAPADRDSRQTCYRRPSLRASVSNRLRRAGLGCPQWPAQVTLGQ